MVIPEAQRDGLIEDLRYRRDSLLCRTRRTANESCAFKKSFISLGNRCRRSVYRLKEGNDVERTWYAETPAWSLHAAFDVTRWPTAKATCFPVLWVTQRSRQGPISFC
jgi:hypothetical protein